LPNPQLHLNGSRIAALRQHSPQGLTAGERCQYAGVAHQPGAGGDDLRQVVASQVKEILQTTPAQLGTYYRPWPIWGRVKSYDAEHFFDAFKEDRLRLKPLQALSGGAQSWCYATPTGGPDQRVIETIKTVQGVSGAPGNPCP
jgi:hypothetical protein